MSGHCSDEGIGDVVWRFQRGLCSTASSLSPLVVPLWLFCLRTWLPHRCPQGELYVWSFPTLCWLLSVGTAVVRVWGVWC